MTEANKLKEGQRVKVILYYREGLPMFDYGYVFMKDGKAHVTFDDYERRRGRKETAHTIPLENYLGYELVE